MTTGKWQHMTGPAAADGGDWQQHVQFGGEMPVEISLSDGYHSEVSTQA